MIKKNVHTEHFACRSAYEVVHMGQMQISLSITSIMISSPGG